MTRQRLNAFLPLGAMWALSALVVFSGSTSWAGTLSDDFSSVADYSDGSVSGIWDGSYNMPNLAGGLFGSNLFANEELYVDDNNVTNVGWEGGRSTAPFLFVDTNSDEAFTATVKITSQTSGTWSAAGLIARAKQGTPPGTGADNDDEHFVTMTSFRTDDRFPDQGTTLMKRIENGAQLNDLLVNVDLQTVDNPDYDPNDPNSPEFIDVSINPLPFYLRLERQYFDLGPGQTGVGYQGSVSQDGINWQVQSTVFPTPGSPLLTGNPIEVGLVYQNYGGVAGASTFDDFSLTTGTLIPEPTSLGMLLIASILGACGWRSRHH